MRSSTDCKLGGVCGGLAEYLDVDSTIVRLIWVVLILFPFPLIPAVLGYFVAWLVIPQAPPPIPVEVSAQPAAPSAPPRTRLRPDGIKLEVFRKCCRVTRHAPPACN